MSCIIRRVGRRWSRSIMFNWVGDEDKGMAAELIRASITEHLGTFSRDLLTQLHVVTERQLELLDQHREILAEFRGGLSSFQNPRTAKQPEGVSAVVDATWAMFQTVHTKILKKRACISTTSGKNISGHSWIYIHTFININIYIYIYSFNSLSPYWFMYLYISV